MNGLMIDVEVKKCIPKNNFSDLEEPVGDYIYKQKLDYIYDKGYEEETLIEKITELQLEMLNPHTGKVYEHCASWTDYKNMGVSVVGVWDFVNNLPVVYVDLDIPSERYALQTMINQAKFIVGFNNIRFDNNLLEANGIQINNKPNFDILRAIWKSLKLNPDNFTDQHKGFGLDSLGAMVGLRKNGLGAMAPKLWQQGKIGEACRYCLQDIMLQRSIFLRGLEGKLIHPVTGNALPKLSLEEGLENNE